MKPIVRVLLAMCLVGCGGTNYVFENADSATVDVRDVDRRESEASPAIESDAIADALGDSADEAAAVLDAGRPRDAGRDVSVRDASADVSVRDSGDGGNGLTDAPADAPCVPMARLLACANAQCGAVPDGCTGTYTCGTCPSPRVCAANSCQCPTMTDATYCSLRRYSCGSVLDACSGATRNCGVCTGSQSCGGGGKPNVCCNPITTCPVGDNCGTVPDGCGGVVDCGSCTGFEKCNGAGKRNQCGCTRLTCTDANRCGSMPDGCGGVALCPGLCGLGQFCGAGAGGADAGGAEGGSSSCAPNTCCSACTPTFDPSCSLLAFSCDPAVSLPGCSPSATSTIPDAGTEAGADADVAADGAPPVHGVTWCCP